MAQPWPWYRRHAEDAAKEERALTIEQQGALTRINDHLMAEGEPLRDAERLLSGFLNISIQKWKRLRRELIDDGFLKVVARGDIQLISTSRFEVEVAHREAASIRNSNAARARRGKAQRQKDLNNQEGYPCARNASAHADRDSRRRGSTAPSQGEAVDPTGRQWAELLAAVEELAGPAFMVSYVSRASLEAGRLVPATGAALRAIRGHREVSALLAERGIELVARSPRNSANDTFS